jgi:hypothetical protein
MRTTVVFDDLADDNKTNNLKIDVCLFCRPLGRWPWFLLASLEHRCFIVESPFGDIRNGLVRVFQIPNGQTDWEQLGSDILPMEDTELVDWSFGDGRSLGISPDGQTLAVGATGALEMVGLWGSRLTDKLSLWEPQRQLQLHHSGSCPGLSL